MKIGFLSFGHWTPSSRSQTALPRITAYGALILDAQVKAGDLAVVRLRVCTVPSAESGSIMF
jgi:hypothetical protein